MPTTTTTAADPVAAKIARDFGGMLDWYLGSKYRESKKFKEVVRLASSGTKWTTETLRNFLTKKSRH